MMEYALWGVGHPYYDEAAPCRHAFPRDDEYVFRSMNEALAFAEEMYRHYAPDAHELEWYPLKQGQCGYLPMFPGGKVVFHPVWEIRERSMKTEGIEA